jgi:hypothetical protein
MDAEAALADIENLGTDFTRTGGHVFERDPGGFVSTPWLSAGCAAAL